MVKLNLQNIRMILRWALKEDQGHGDATTECILDSSVKGQADFLAKSELVLAGWPLVTEVFQMLSPQFSSKSHFKEGELVSKGSIIGSIFGPANLLLTGERVALNFLQRLCGIATQTRQFVQAEQLQHVRQATKRDWRAKPRSLKNARQRLRSTRVSCRSRKRDKIKMPNCQTKVALSHRFPPTLSPQMKAMSVLRTRFRY